MNILFNCPDEIICSIFKWLGPKELCKVAQVCKKTLEISSADFLWRPFLLNKNSIDDPIRPVKSIVLGCSKDLCRSIFSRIFDFPSSMDIYDKSLQIQKKLLKLEEEDHEAVKKYFKQITSSLYSNQPDAQAIKDLKFMLEFFEEKKIYSEEKIVSEKSIICALSFFKNYTEIVWILLVGNFSEDSVLFYLQKSVTKKIEGSQTLKTELIDLAKTNKYSDQVINLIEEQFLLSKES